MCEIIQNIKLVAKQQWDVDEVTATEEKRNL
jgi:hypothetical protein